MKMTSWKIETEIPMILLIAMMMKQNCPDFVHLKTIVGPVAGLRKTVIVLVGFVAELVMRTVVLAVGPMTTETVHSDFAADLVVVQKMIATVRIVPVVELS